MMKPDTSRVVGIDVGGTNVRLALVNGDGTLAEKLKMPTRHGRNALIAQLAEGIALLAKKAFDTDSPIAAVGIGMPGLISPAGELFTSVNLPYCEGMNLEIELQSLTGMPVVAVNDANAAAVGEYRFGAGRFFRTFIMMTIGTGIGGGVVLDGHLWAGADGFAGEIGHLTVVPDGRPCPCGNRGCVEQYASASAIMSSAREQGIAGASDMTLEALASMAAAGNKRVAALFSEAGRYLGAVSASVINLLNPEAIIVGGGVAASFALMHEAMKNEIADRAYRPSAGRLKIVRGELGDDAGVLGAAAVAFDRLSLS